MALVVFFQISSNLTSVFTLRCSCFSHPGAQEKIWTELYAEQTPFGSLVLLGILHLKELLVNRSASRGELTDWSESDM